MLTTKTLKEKYGVNIKGVTYMAYYKGIVNVYRNRMKGSDFEVNTLVNENDCLPLATELSPNGDVVEISLNFEKAGYDCVHYKDNQKVSSFFLDFKEEEVLESGSREEKEKIVGCYPLILNVCN